MTTTSEYHCGNCPKAKKYPANAPAGKYTFWYCPETKQFLHDKIIRDKIMDITALVGCASHPSAQAALRAEGAMRERVLKEISESLETCAFYDEMIAGEGGCLGNRNGEHECDGCSYFEIDVNQIRATIDSLRQSQSQSTGAQQEEQGGT